MHKEVVEKTLECIRDLAEEMGPGAIEDHIEWIVVSIEQLLDKTAPCQNGKGMDEEGPEEGNAGEDDSEDS